MASGVASLPGDGDGDAYGDGDGNADALGTTRALPEGNVPTGVHARRFQSPSFSGRPEERVRVLAAAAARTPGAAQRTTERRLRVRAV